MLISPMLFFPVARALLVARRAGAIRMGRGTAEPEVAMTAGNGRVILPAGRGGRLGRTRRECRESPALQRGSERHQARDEHARCRTQPSYLV